MVSQKSIILVVLIAAIGSGLLAFASLSMENNQKDPGIMKALILDQLYDDIPNKYFHTKATSMLEDAGYSVDIVTTGNYTVDFFRNLPRMNYDFIVIRSHALSAETEDNSVLIFTGEEYSEKKYITEQLMGEIKKGTPLTERTFSVDNATSTGWQPLNGSDTDMIMTSRVVFEDITKKDYFLVTPKMVEGLNGKFQDSVILLGGCSTMANPSMAKAFEDKGASSVVGWSDLVSSSDNDRMLLKLIEKILVEDQPPKDAVDQLMQDFRSNPKYKTVLKYF